MQAIRERFQQFRERLTGLSGSSRLFVSSLLIILVMGLFLVAQYAGGTDMAPLRVRPAALEATRSWLDTEDVPYTTDDAGRILVKQQDRGVLQVRLATESGVAPGDLDWDAMMRDEIGGSIWDSPEIQKQRANRFTMSILKLMVVNLSFVRDAQVAIDEPDQVRGPGRGFFPSSASVTVETIDAALTATQARAVRSLIASGVAGLLLEDVVLIDQFGTLFAGAEHGAAAAGHLADTAREVEAHFERQIREVLGIGGLRVAVSALAEPRSSYEQGREHGEPVTASRRSSSELAKDRGASFTGGRPGFGSNVGPRANAPMAVASPQKSSEFELESRDNEVIVDATDMAIENPGGYVYKLSAVLNVPRRHLVERFEATGGQGAPTSAELDVLEAKVRAELGGAISMMLQTTPGANDLQGDVIEGDVTVIFGVGSAATAAVTGLNPSTNLANLAGTGVLAVGTNATSARTWVLGGLSVIAIIGLFLIARRSMRQAAAAAAELATEPQSLGGDDVIMGEASEIQPPLDARELDDEELRRKQMLTQLNELVHREPTEAAVLVKQWIRQSA